VGRRGSDSGTEPQRNHFEFKENWKLVGWLLLQAVLEKRTMRQNSQLTKVGGPPIKPNTA
jgi:hypothetical protein